MTYNLTPQKKAKELVSVFSFIEYDQNEGIKIANPTLKDAAKQCALLCINEIIEVVKPVDRHFKPFYESEKESGEYYWQSVKKQIEKL